MKKTNHLTKLIILCLSISIFMLILSNKSFATIKYSYIATSGEKGMEYIWKGSGLDDTNFPVVKINGATYDETTNTLTLNNYNGNLLELQFMGTDFKIKVVGTNNINTNKSDWSFGITVPQQGGGDGEEVFSPNDLLSNVTFIGSGTLNINGYVCLDNITIDGPTINVTNHNVTVQGNFTYKSGILNIKNSNINTDNTTSHNSVIEAQSFNLPKNISLTNKSGDTLYQYKNGIYTTENSEKGLTDNVIMKLKQEKPLNIADAKSGIQLDTTTTQLPENSVLSVKEILTGEDFNKINIALADITSNFKVYDIDILSNNEKVQPNGKVKVLLPIPDNFDTKNLIVYSFTGNTKTEHIVTVVEIGNKKYAQFETDHFSQYVLAQKKEQENNTTNNTEQTNNTTNNKLDDTPKTGIASVVTILSIIGMVSLAGIILTKKKMK